MQVLILSEVRPTEGGLERVAILDAELFPANDTRRRLLTLLYSEGTICEIEDISGLFQQERIDALFGLCIAFIAVTVHEHILLPRMSMQVTEKEELTLLLHLLQ